MVALLHRFRSWLACPTDGSVIGLFRIVFGLFMAYYAWYLYSIGFIDQGLLQPKVLFKYDYLGWIPLAPAPVLYGVLAVMGLSALLLAAGIFFRGACWAFSLCLAYLFFQEKSYYNNHIYLFILLPLLLSATDADRFFSLRRSANGPVLFIPRWQQFILQAQIVIVYFFAGVVKMKADWLVREEPMRTLIAQFPDNHWMAGLLKHDFNIHLFTYGGFALDILSPLLLWYKPLRNWAWAPFALFHLSNSQIFDDISIFPYVMLAALILFFDAGELPLLKKRTVPAPRPVAGVRRKQKENRLPAETTPMTPARPYTRRLLLAYFVFQALFPLRGFLLPNPLDYTTIGNRFAWRVKADIRIPVELSYFYVAPALAEPQKVDIVTLINTSQIRTLVSDPRVARDFARFLRAEAARNGFPNVQVKARIRLRYNGRPDQFFVDPDVDLAAVPYSPFRKLDWVSPLER